MPTRRTHAEGMPPLQALIINTMRERGWSPKQVEDRGVSHATLHRYMNPVELRQPPRKSILRDLATALDLPLSKVERAAVDSVGYGYSTTDEPAEPIPARMVVSIEEAIEADPDLPDIAKAHLLSQVALLRHLRDGLPPELELEQERRRQQAILTAKGTRILEALPDPVPPTPRKRKG